MTYTYALVDVSAASYAELKETLAKAGYANAFHDDGDSDGVMIDMHGLALRLRPQAEGEDIGTSCILDFCKLPIPERRVRQRSNTCSKEHANLLRSMYRKQADRRRCRSCAKPSTPEQRASYRAWLKDHPEFRPGGPSGKRGWPKGQKRTKAGTLHPVTPEAARDAEIDNLIADPPTNCEVRDLESGRLVAAGPKR